MQVVPMEASHLDQINIQEMQAYFKSYIVDNPTYAKMLVEHSEAYTALGETGQVVCCMGILPKHENCGEAWAIISDQLPRYRLSVVRAVKQFLAKQHKYKRIHITCATNFQEAHKFASILGFKSEALLRCWDVQGQDHIMYTIIKQDLQWSCS